MVLHGGGDDSVDESIKGVGIGGSHYCRDRLSYYCSFGEKYLWFRGTSGVQFRGFLDLHPKSGHSEKLYAYVHISDIIYTYKPSAADNKNHTPNP